MWKSNVAILKMLKNEANFPSRESFLNFRHFVAILLQLVDSYGENLFVSKCNNFHPGTPSQKPEKSRNPLISLKKIACSDFGSFPIYTPFFNTNNNNSFACARARGSDDQKGKSTVSDTRNEKAYNASHLSMAGTAPASFFVLGVVA